MTLINKNIRRNRWVLFSVILILIVTLTPMDGKIAGNYLDKLAHFIVFLILGINISYKYYKNEKLVEVMFACIIFGLLTEVIQQFIPGRNMDIYDGIADCLGLIVGYYLYKTNDSKFDALLKKMGA